MATGRSTAYVRQLIVVAASLLEAAIAMPQPSMLRVTGTVVDPSGLGVPSVEVTFVDSVTGVSRSAVSDASGQYRLMDLPVGSYRVDVDHPGFAPYFREVVLDRVPAEPLEIHLALPEFRESVTVRTSRPGWSNSDLGRDFSAPPNPFATDTTRLLESQPGVSVYANGGVSSLPVIHGMADDRVRIRVDGIDLISACANHMNPPLSYVDPSAVGSIDVFAGITPVSVGGDSIGGTILLASPRPVFASSSQHLALSGQAVTSYRGQGNGYGGVLQFAMAGESLSLTYNGSLSRADNYTASQDFKVGVNAAVDRGWLSGSQIGSSRYESQNHALGFAMRQGEHLLDLNLGLQFIPYQGFPNQRMDMTRNNSERANFRYSGHYGWVGLEARAYGDYTRHSMDFADDKQFYYGSAATIMAPGMPMETKGVNLGASVKADIPLKTGQSLRVGGDAQRYRLDDWWPPSPSVLPPGYTSGGMAPDTFININAGRRDRLAVYAEWEASWGSRWRTLLGMRNDNVMMNTGTVHGYNNTMMYNGAPLYPATTFNQRDRKRTDHNVDLTALSRYAPSSTFDLEAGYARKSRSPNLYERYAWSTNTMRKWSISPATAITTSATSACWPRRRIPSARP
jgi:iron complex outermembrane recepter protein